MTRAYLGVGSNLGDKVSNIRRAVLLLEENSGIHDVTVSPLYRTEPIGFADQDWFVNAAIELKTDLSAIELLDWSLAVERSMKRVRMQKWGPRIIDLDILFFGTMELRQEALTIPHPRIGERAFVLAPLCDLNPTLQLGEKTVAELLAEVGCHGVEKL